MRLTSSLAAEFTDQFPSGVVALTGAAPVTGGGADLWANVDRHLVMPGSVSASVEVNLKASSLTMTPQWQVSLDGSTWITLSDQNGAAGTSVGTGSGSDADLGPFRMVAPAAIHAFPHARLAVVTGGSATGVVAHDNIKQIKYSYLLRDHIGE